MSANKTEKPTPKKLKDAAQKGKSFKSKDLVISCLIFLGCLYLTNYINFTAIIDVWANTLKNNHRITPLNYTFVLLFSALKIFLPFLFLCILIIMLTTMAQTGFKIATKVLKLDFNTLNPINGIKKIFNIRTIKGFIKTFLFILVFFIVTYIYWGNNKKIIFAQIYLNIQDVFLVWKTLLIDFIVILLLSSIIVLILDSVAEYFIHIKDLKMDKNEVKREHKEQEGNPEIKSKRKELHVEILSEQVKRDIKSSKFMIANPTHVIIGIYLNPQIVAIPMVSVLEKNQRALAARAYAEKEGVLVIENIALARRIYNTHQLYSFINLEEIGEIIKILSWLQKVENEWDSEVT
ncbi:EscU/YscU/HrcU family type III secretion system export apparatus switch protein [Candidatus Arsenophonus nilaparvatae]|uniref:EscU/YscU/HrcU family type III secretion system export apparatus switch protein n=1 Tax=Candidatus Arsenophonus nilaparvatae TaxID=1247023 RepID=UPI000509F31C|nr:EscU/YscU/HrcU family type III secretion system export apparatus switch protein [Candidatus Arsenophonus nilaparvatae]